MIEMLKRQWFVVLVALIFIGFAVFCIYDSNKDRVSGKTNDGKDVVAAMKDDTYIYACLLYTSIFVVPDSLLKSFLQISPFIPYQKKKIKDILLQNIYVCGIPFIMNGN